MGTAFLQIIKENVEHILSFLERKQIMAKIAVFYDHLLEIARQESISPAEALQEARRLGIACAEVSYENARESPARLAKLLASAGLRVSCMPCFFDFGRDPNPLASILPVLEAAKELGADKLLAVPGFWAQNEDSETREQQTQNMIRALCSMAGLAERQGITLTIEDYDSRLAPYSTVNGLNRFLAGCPGLALTFDTGNFRYSGEDALEAWDALGNRAAHVHLKDRALTPIYGEEGLPAAGETLYPCPVGKGVIPIEQLVERMKDGNYGGIYTIEHYGAKDMLGCLRQSAGWLRGVLA